MIYFMNNLSNYINEALSKVDIERVKDFLIKKYHVSTWEECVDAQKFGDCRKICTMIWKKFPGMFDDAYDIYIDYTPIAMKKLNDNCEDFGNHYVLQKGSKIYDFARGANCYNGIYLLTQYEDMHDKYDVIFTKAEEKCINNKIKRLLVY